MINHASLRLAIFSILISLGLITALWSIDIRMGRAKASSLGNFVANNPPQTAGRWALVIGNANYQYHPKLANPGNDANAFAQALKAVGFEVINHVDLSKEGMEGCIKQFSDRTSKGGAA